MSALNCLLRRDDSNVAVVCAKLNGEDERREQTRSTCLEECTSFSHGEIPLSFAGPSA